MKKEVITPLTPFESDVRLMRTIQKQELKKSAQTRSQKLRAIERKVDDQIRQTPDEMRTELMTCVRLVREAQHQARISQGFRYKVRADMFSNRLDAFLNRLEATRVSHVVQTELFPAD